MPCPTTRSYPRTLQQAFPHDREWAYPIQGYRRRRFDSVANVLSAIGLGAMLAWTLAAWWGS